MEVRKTDTRELKEAADAEAKRLTGILEAAGVSEKRRHALVPVIENTAWMLAKLEDARDAIKGSNVAIQYDNGGGQKGIRENPAFKGYEALWRSYMVGMGRILDSLPPEAVTEAEPEDVRPATILEVVRARHEA